MRICRICLLPQNFPNTRFNEAGVCQFCQVFERSKAAHEQLREDFKSRFAELVKKLSNVGTYDVLVCYSGGKDSTYTLHLFKDIYRLKVLAFTFDNGFIADQTLINIRRVIEKLDVDHFFFKPEFSILKKIFRRSLESNIYSPKVIERASVVCTSCIGFVKYLSFKFAIEKQIPFIGYGWTPGQASIDSSILKLEPSMVRAIEAQIKEPLRKIVGDEIDRYFLADEHYTQTESFPYMIHPAAFFKYDEKNIYKRIKKLGWIKPKGLDANSTNCLLNSLTVQTHQEQYGFNPYVFEIAKLVREGYLKRSEGMRRINQKVPKLTVEKVKQKLGV